jgi:uncharacterized membrane protein
LEEAYARAEELGRDDTYTYRGRRRQSGHEPAGGSWGIQNVGDTERAISVAAGVGMATIGLLRGRWDGWLLAAAGAGLVWRGYTGHCQCYAALGIDTAMHSPAVGVPAQQGEKVETSITIGRSPAELYEFWRRLENLPRVMSHLKEVQSLDPQRSHWVALAPLGQELAWDAEIWNERENELIAWRSVPGGDIDTAGSVHFKPAAQPGCCEVTISMKFNPPAGKLGVCVAEWLGDGLEQKIVEDLRRFKQEMESAAPMASIAERGAALDP